MVKTRGGRSGTSNNKGNRRMPGSHSARGSSKGKGRGRGRGKAQSKHKHNLPNNADEDVLRSFENLLVDDMSYDGKRGRMSELGRKITYNSGNRHIETDRNSKTGLKIVEFIKAKHSYNPSEDFMKKLKGNSENTTPEKMIEKNANIQTSEDNINFNQNIADDKTSKESLDLEEVQLSKTTGENIETSSEEEQSDGEKELMDAEGLPVANEMVEVKKLTETHEETFTKTEKLRKVEESLDGLNSATNRNEIQFSIEDEGNFEVLQHLKVDRPKSIKNIIEVNKDNISTGKVEHTPYLTIGKLELNTEFDENENVFVNSSAKIKGNAIKFSSNKNDMDKNYHKHSIPESFDDEIYNHRGYISNVMEFIGKHFDNDDVYVSDTNFEDFDEHSEEISNRTFSEDSKSTFDDRTAINNERSGDIYSDSDSISKDEVPEYGFLPEDYEFDTSQMEITNIRYGIRNKYFVKCPGLTGEESSFMWVDEDDLFDYVLSNGVQEHRLNRFLHYITKGLIDTGSEDKLGDEISDVYVSDSDEEFYESDIGGEMEDDGLDDLLAFAKNHVPQNFEPAENQKLSVLGKGSKRRLLLDEIAVDPLLKDSLESAFQIRNSSKISNADKRKQAKLEEAIRRGDLLAKYPYAIYVKDMRKEFENLINSKSRETMSFPPLDSHGNKTLIKLAKYYNLKSLRCGNGVKKFIKVSKSKKTYKCIPNHEGINLVMKQRPVFNRTDQKKPKHVKLNEEKKEKIRKMQSGYTPQHKEGDFVGAFAPEIGQENFGRQILEKLGWVKGEGLGTHGNKGISEPLMAKMKTSKQGLRTTP